MTSSACETLFLGYLRTLHRFEEATHRTTRWLDRCIAAHSRPTEQNLFAIVQGGLDERLRDISLKV